MITEAPAVLTNEEEPTDSAAAASLGEHEVVQAGRIWSPVAVTIWLLFAGGITLFIAFSRVPIAAGWRQARSMRVLDIWELFTLELSQVAGPLVTPALATGLVVVVLAGSLLGLWLAMRVTNEQPTERLAERPD